MTTATKSEAAEYVGNRVDLDNLLRFIEENGILESHSQYVDTVESYHGLLVDRMPEPYRKSCFACAVGSVALQHHEMDVEAAKNTVDTATDQDWGSYWEGPEGRGVSPTKMGLTMPYLLGLESGYEDPNTPPQFQMNRDLVQKFQRGGRSYVPRAMTEFNNGREDGIQLRARWGELTQSRREQIEQQFKDKNKGVLSREHHMVLSYFDSED